MKGICPVCNGTTRQSASGYRYKKVTHGYDEVTDTLPCNNCGGQTMSLYATGEVPLRPDGTPCKHEFNFANVGRCLTRYTCNHCKYSYEIDSGD